MDGADAPAILAYPARAAALERAAPLTSILTEPTVTCARASDAQSAAAHSATAAIDRLDAALP